MDDLKKEK
jgi:hypothetical protein